MDIYDFYNPETDLKYTEATDVEIFITLALMVVITIIFLYIRAKDSKKNFIKI